MTAPTKIVSSIAGYPVDVVKQYNFKYKSKATTHPVEKGADLTDNIVPDPIAFTLDCVISDTPTGSIASDPTRQNTNPAKDADAAFVAVFNARLPITVVTPRGTFTSFAMTEYSPTGNSVNGNALVFTCSFEQIVIVTNTRTTVRVAVPNGNSTKHLGDKPAPYGVSGNLYVLRVPSTQDGRKRYTKLYGPPTSCSDASEVNWDHYKIDPNQVTPSGYMDPLTHYHPMQGVNDAGVAQSQFDPTDDTWKNADGTRMNQNTNGGQWNQMTGKNPPPAPGLQEAKQNPFR